MNERLSERGPRLRRRFVVPAYPTLAALGLGASLSVAAVSVPGCMGMSPQSYGHDARPAETVSPPDARDTALSPDTDPQRGDAGAPVDAMDAGAEAGTKPD